jgi:hypothetical protein
MIVILKGCEKIDCRPEPLKAAKDLFIIEPDSSPPAVCACSATRLAAAQSDKIGLIHKL